MPSLGRHRGPGGLLKVLLHLHQDRLMPGLMCRQGISCAVLEHHSLARQIERHADVAVGWTLAWADARRLEELPRCGPVEPWDVDADAGLLTLVRAVSRTLR